MRFRYEAIRRGRVAVCQMAVLLLTPFASTAPTGKAPAVPATLRSIQEVFRLDKNHARNGYPVRLQAVVTYSDMEWGLLFVQDETGAVYINVHGMAESFPVGARVRVTP